MAALRALPGVAAALAVAVALPGTYLYFRPHVRFSYVLDGRLREESWSTSIVDFGLAIGVEF
jgi:hypothetical protein